MSGADTKSRRIKGLILQGLDASLGRLGVAGPLWHWFARRGDGATTSSPAAPVAGVLRRLRGWLGQRGGAAAVHPEIREALEGAPQAPDLPGVRPEVPSRLVARAVRVSRAPESSEGCVPGRVQLSAVPDEAPPGAQQSPPQAPEPPARPHTLPGPGAGVRAGPPPDETEQAAPRLAVVSPRPLEARPGTGVEAKAAEPIASPRVEAAAAPPPLPGWVIPLDPRPIPRSPVARRVVVIGDCENDSSCVEATLRFLGALDKRGGLKARIRGAQIVQTGDLLQKNAPSLGIVRFWEGLRSAAAVAGCGLHLVAGNHELEIWRRLQGGERLGLNPEGQRAVQSFIRSLVLFHVEGSALFLHGYPTLDLLRDLQAYRRDRGRPLNDYNAERFQRALGDSRQLARYAYLRGDQSRAPLLYDLADPGRYYRRHGREVARLLGALGIGLVVHGHRPERSGLQTDYELRKWLPGIRMINNDIQLRLQGLGATLIQQGDRGPAEVYFVNRSTLTLSDRDDARRLLRADVVAGDAAAPLDQPSPRRPVSSLVPLGKLAGGSLSGKMRAAAG